MPPPPDAPPVAFDPAIALEYARGLAQPRRVGTPGEAAAINAIAGRLEAAGWQVERQPFRFSTAAQVATTLQVLTGQILILLTFAAWGHGPWPGVVPAALLLALLAVTGRVLGRVAAASIEPADGETATAWQWLCRQLGERLHSENVVGRRPAAAGRLHVYLVAHSDSKSQVLPLTARIGLIALAGGLAVLFGGLAVLRPLLPGLTSAAALAGLGALLAGVPVLYLFLAGAGNASPGAIDNASGAGLVLHLAEVLRARQPEVNLTCLVTGAEELGLIGATAYLLAAQRSGRLATETAQRLYVLNFDGIGGAGRLAMVGGRAGRLEALVRACCVELALPLGRLPLIGALFDHLPFAEAGVEALSLVTVGRAARAVHTAADSADQLDVDGFRQAGEVALRVIERLAIPGAASPTSSGSAGSG